jgi:hypothetical protein
MSDLKVVQYGSTDRIAASHPEFKARYLAGLKETLQFGKRPDLLLFPASVSVDADWSERRHAETEATVKQATAAIEVRSSKFEALTYMKVRQRQRAAGKTTARETPSDTACRRVTARCFSIQCSPSTSSTSSPPSGVEAVSPSRRQRKARRRQPS